MKTRNILYLRAHDLYSVKEIRGRKHHCLTLRVTMRPRKKGRSYRYTGN